MSNERQLANLKKSAADKKIAGVCGGLGEYTPVPTWVWRVLFLVSLFIGGLGFLSYIALWIFMPAADTAIRQERLINPEPPSDNSL